jgi:hypothetical protein
MGDKAFGAMLRQIIAEHGRGVFNLTAMQNLATKAAGTDMGWFFDQWVRGVGLPRVELVDACEVPGEGGKKDLVVTLIQKGTKSFQLPLDVVVDLEGGGVWKTRLDVRETTSMAVLQPSGKPVKVTLDPESWTLKHPRSEEWTRAVSDQCSSAGLTAVQVKELPRPEGLGVGLEQLGTGASKEAGVVARAGSGAATGADAKVSDRPTTASETPARRNPRRGNRSGT